MWQITISHEDEENNHNEVIAYNPLIPERQILSLGFPLKPISCIDPSDTKTILDYLGDLEFREGILLDAGYYEKIFPINELRVSPRVHIWSERKWPNQDNIPPGFRFYYCTILTHRGGYHYTAEGKRRRLFEHSSYARHGFYFDVPFDKVHQWFRGIEKTLMEVFPEVIFSPRVGICESCEKEIDPGSLLCSLCSERENIKSAIQKEEWHKKFRKNLNDSLRERGHIIPIPCHTCGSIVWRQKRSFRGQPVFCSGICKRAKFPPKGRRIKYSPAYLDFLLRQAVSHCHSIGCYDSQAKGDNPWGLCAYHLNLLKSSLRGRKRTRQRLLWEAGLT